MKLGKAVVRSRVVILIIALALMVPSVIGMICTRVNYDMLNYLPESLDTVKGQKYMLEDFNKGAFSFLIFENADEKTMREASEKIKEVDHVATVLNFSDIADGAIPEELLPDKIYEAVNKGDDSLMAVFFDSSSSSDETISAITEIRRICDGQCLVSGISAMVTDLRDLCEREEAVYVGIAVVLAVAAMMLFGLVVAPVAASVSVADGETPAQQGNGLTNTDDGKPVDGTEKKKSGPGGFVDVVFGSGVLGVILWAALFLDGAAAIDFIVDFWVLIKPQKLMPQTLINNVQGAVAEGDVMKAIKACEAEPSPMSNVLAAAFQHVEDGYDVIQESVNAAADLEIERIMQRLTWISVCSNLAPSLGLLGTVQGMILCFATLASGVPDIGALAGNISQALWTTAGGLVVSIPSLTLFYSIRNNANRLILRMTALTMELIKPLRNVEVDSEA